MLSPTQDNEDINKPTLTRLMSDQQNPGHDTLPDLETQALSIHLPSLEDSALVSHCHLQVALPYPNYRTPALDLQPPCQRH
jgi:hypothetical protein